MSAVTRGVRKDRPNGPFRPRAARRAAYALGDVFAPQRRDAHRAVNPVVVEIALVAVTALAFWLLDRFVIGCGRL